VSVYVESTITEPQMSGSQIKLTYPQGVTAIAVTDGEFDSYLEKNIDSTTRTISINAVNNAGNEKNGKIKLASISFETTLTTGQIQLLIASDSTITGTGGEQLLTETVNGTYNLKIDGTGTATDTTATTTDTDATLSTTTAVPVTGTNETLFYLTIAALFMTAGVFSYKKITVK
jgi:expansin (peptidoglycan-binding protein)